MNTGLIDVQSQVCAVSIANDSTRAAAETGATTKRSLADVEAVRQLVLPGAGSAATRRLEPGRRFSSSTNCRHLPAARPVALLTAFALADAAVAAEALSEEDAKALADFGTKAFGIHWNGQMRSAVQRNVQAVSDGTITLTTRKGSRTSSLTTRS